jgi:hypothetical protein
MINSARALGRALYPTRHKALQLTTLSSPESLSSSNGSKPSRWSLLCDERVSKTMCHVSNPYRVRTAPQSKCSCHRFKFVSATSLEHVLGDGDTIRRYQNISTTNPLLLPWQDFGTSTGRVTIVTLWVKPLVGTDAKATRRCTGISDKS